MYHEETYSISLACIVKAPYSKGSTGQDFFTSLKQFMSMHAWNIATLTNYRAVLSVFICMSYVFLYILQVCLIDILLCIYM